MESALRRRYLRGAADILDQIKPKIIGITGSYGKTTTKHFLRDILSVRYRAYATPKSYNTLMGISLAINRDLADDYRCEYFICEMGAYVEGEIERICQLTPPDIAIVTEVGPQHLERFGSLDNIRRAKYEIVKNTASRRPRGLELGQPLRSRHGRGGPSEDRSHGQQRVDARSGARARRRLDRQRCRGDARRLVVYGYACHIR